MLAEKHGEKEKKKRCDGSSQRLTNDEEVHKKNEVISSFNGMSSKQFNTLG